MRAAGDPSVLYFGTNGRSWHPRVVGAYERKGVAGNSCRWVGDRGLSDCLAARPRNLSFRHRTLGAINCTLRDGSECKEQRPLREGHLRST
jgi:hypothetical protein